MVDCASVPWVSKPSSCSSRDRSPSEDVVAALIAAGRYAVEPRDGPPSGCLKDDKIR
jgi:hypothetical protein